MLAEHEDVGGECKQIRSAVNKVSVSLYRFYKRRGYV